MCTAVRFSNEEGSVFLGRNLDWSCGYGENVRIMPKGFMIPWAFDESTPAKHAVIGNSRTTPCSSTVETTRDLPWPA